MDVYYNQPIFLIYLTLTKNLVGLSKRLYTNWSIVQVWARSSKNSPSYGPKCLTTRFRPNHFMSSRRLLKLFCLLTIHLFSGWFMILNTWMTMLRSRVLIPLLVLKIFPSVQTPFFRFESTTINLWQQWSISQQVKPLTIRFRLIVISLSSIPLSIDCFCRTFVGYRPFDSIPWLIVLFGEKRNEKPLQTIQVQNCTGPWRHFHRIKQISKYYMQNSITRAIFNRFG
jgi:hypothetical protein